MNGAVNGHKVPTGAPAFASGLALGVGGIGLADPAAREVLPDGMEARARVGGALGGRGQRLRLGGHPLRAPDRYRVRSERQASHPLPEGVRRSNGAGAVVVPGDQIEARKPVISERPQKVRRDAVHREDACLDLRLAGSEPVRIHPKVDPPLVVCERGRHPGCAPTPNVHAGEDDDATRHPRGGRPRPVLHDDVVAVGGVVQRPVGVGHGRERPPHGLREPHDLLTLVEPAACAARDSQPGESGSSLATA